MIEGRTLALPSAFVNDHFRHSQTIKSASETATILRQISPITDDDGIIPYAVGHKKSQLISVRNFVKIN